MFKKFLNMFENRNDDSNEEDSLDDDVRLDESNDDDDDDDENDEDEDSDNDEDDDDEDDNDDRGGYPTDYNEEEFDAEVERRSNEWIEQEKADGEDLSQADIDNIKYNYRREVYREWTGANDNELIRWEQANQQKYTGMAAFGHTVHDENNPLLQPIHGISLEDYAAIAFKITEGAKYEDILSAFGIDTAVYEEVSALWVKRMQEDTTYSVVMLFGQYQTTAPQHPKLSGIVVEMSDREKETFEKLKQDRLFYEELCGARSAAYEAGLDGSQWLLDNFGISLGAFQQVASMYMDQDSKNIDLNRSLKYSNYMEKKMQEYAAKFAAEGGGGAADDIDF